MNTKKIRVLAYVDSPACATGFATVSRNILNGLVKTGKYDIDIIGINDKGGWKDPKEFPYRIYPAKVSIDETGDFHGRPRFIASILGKDPEIKNPWDIVFTLNDPYILEFPVPVFNKGTMTVVNAAQQAFKKKLPKNYWFKTIAYIPVDSDVKGNWIEKSINLIDYPIAYTEYGKDEIVKSDESLDKVTGVKDRVNVIYHGINFQEFHPVSKKQKSKFRKDFFEGRVKPETFLIVAVARNQLRKDLPRTMAVFSEFIKRRPQSFLYLHCQETDAWCSLKEYARNFPNLEYGTNWGVPAKFSANTGFPVEALNLIYNSADCVLSTTLGEGFGFYNFEGFATKTPIVAPNNTVHPELFEYDKYEDISDMNTLYQKVRGIPIKCASTSSEWVALGRQDLERIRPVVNIADAAKKLIWVYDNPDKVAKITNRSFEYVKQYDWNNIVKKWDKLFQKVYDKLENERQKSPDNPNIEAGVTQVKL